MSHASTTDFSSHPTKPTAYTHLHTTLTSLLTDTRFWPTNTANTASLLWHLFHSLPSPSSFVNWAGFYVRSPTDPDMLLLGPFMGKVACQSIRVGRGVCGAAVESGETVVVGDVETFPGHIACDGDTRSEVVVPILREGKCVGVIDIDCTELNGFDEEDKRGLEEVARLLADACDW